MRRSRLLISGVAIAALAFGAVSCGDEGPAVTCVDWDHDKVKKTVTPQPKRTYNKTLKRWENGPTPKPYVTQYTKVECEEWETESPTPTSS